MRIEPCLLFACFYLVTAIAADDAALAQHVHGRIEIGVVLEEDALSVTLRSPLADLVGFEHVPETEEQTDRLERAVATLEDPNAMFGTPASAQCVARDSSIDGPRFLVELLETGPGDDHKEHQDSHTEHAGEDGHTREAGHSDENDHGADSHETHAEVIAEYLWQCGEPSELNTLTLRFVQHFESVEEISVELLTPTGTVAFEADATLDSIPMRTP